MATGLLINLDQRRSMSRSICSTSKTGDLWAFLTKRQYRVSFVTLSCPLKRMPLVFFVDPVQCLCLLCEYTYTRLPFDIPGQFSKAGSCFWPLN